MDVFAAFRAGVGYDPGWGKEPEFCSEFEIGLHLTQTFFLGFFANVFPTHYHYEDYNYEDGTTSVVGLRIGFDIGKSKAWK